MDIIKTLTGASNDAEIVSPISTVDIPVNIDDNNLVKGLQGSFSETKSKQEHSPKTTKNMFKQVNNTLTKIYNTITNNSSPANSELYEKVSELSKEVIENKVYVTELRKELVKTPQDKMREADDNKEKAIEVVKESFTKVIEESDTITSIEDNLVELNTKVKTMTGEGSSPGLVGSILTILQGIDGPIGKIATAVFDVLGLTKGLPKVIKNTLSFLKTKTSALIKPITSVISKIIPDKIKDIATKKTAAVVGKNLAKEGVEQAGKAGLKSLIKKVPIIGALVGAGFAIPRLMKGDFLGASMEFASGVSSTLPGLGTAASVGIDAALFARDITQKTDVSTVDLDINKDKTKKIIESTKPTNIVNDNTVVNNHSSNVRNIDISDTEKDFIQASRIG